jgi:hypothetical protein
MICDMCCMLWGMTNTPTGNQAIGAHLQYRAKIRGITRDQIAAITGWKRSKVDRHMRGETPLAVIDLLLYARVLGDEVVTGLPRLDSNQQPTGWRVDGTAA